MSEHLDDLKATGARQSFPREGIHLRTTVVRFGLTVTGVQYVNLPCKTVTAEQLITWNQFEEANFDIIKHTEDLVMACIQRALVLLAYKDGPYVN